MSSVTPNVAATAAVSSSRGPRWRDAAFVLGHAALLAAILFVYLRGWDRDFTVPLQFSRDSISAALQSKSTIDNGWWWFNWRVGAPFGLDALQYPAAPNVDQALVWLVSRVVRDPMTAITATWLLMVVLSGLSATWCIRTLGASRISAFVSGTLFALLPYALYRNVGHFWLVIYLVPFVCTAAVFLAMGRPQRWSWGRPFAGHLAGCLLLALNYVYYAFFGCVIVLVASIVGAVQCRSRRVLGAGAFCLVLIGGGTALNLAPSLYSWAQRGVPIAVPDKTPAEAETYGLKIRHLLSPGLWHTFPPFRAWLARENAAAFPLENENTGTRLGVVGSAGFLVLLAWLFVPRLGDRLTHGDTITAMSRLTLAAVLLATVGGLGSLFNLLVSPDIRAYNRIAPFIAFFSFATVALVLDDTVRSRRARAGIAIAVALVGLADQRAAAIYLNATHKAIATEYSGVRQFVRGLETQLPAGAMVFQLPVRSYPDGDRPLPMQPYDHAKMYLTSRTLRWSYPTLSNQQVRWQQAATLLPVARLVPELASQGFSAVEIDRDGYADHGASIVAAIEQQPGVAVLASTARYVVVDLRRVSGPPPAESFLTRAAGTSPVTAHLPACQTPTSFYVDRVNGRTAQQMALGPVHVESSGTFKVEGWAVDEPAQSTGTGVDVRVDGALFPSIYGFEREDVTAHFSRPAYLQSGFIAAVPARGLGPGRHALALRIASADGRCAYETPEQPVVVD
jgi:phosphoglycerol transferase